MTFDELKRLMGDIHDVLYDVAARGCDEPHDIRNCLACRAYTARVEIMDFDPDAVALANGYIRLAPDEVVVKRATAEHARRLSDCYHCDDPDCRCGECEADLEAALEVK